MAVLGLTVLGITAALAATTWTVRPGGPTSLASGTLTLKDTKTGSIITCAASRLSGMLKTGSGMSGTGIGSIPAGTFTNCTSPLGVVFTFTATDLPWRINVVSYHAATHAVTGNFSHVQVGGSSPGCSFVIDGTSGTASDGIVRFAYHESTDRLKITGGNLHIYAVQGCFGLVDTGDPVTVTATFTVSPGQTITSP